MDDPRTWLLLLAMTGLAALQSVLWRRAIRERRAAHGEGPVLRTPHRLAVLGIIGTFVAVGLALRLTTDLISDPASRTVYVGVAALSTFGAWYSLAVTSSEADTEGLPRRS